MIFLKIEWVFVLEDLSQDMLKYKFAMKVLLSELDILFEENEISRVKEYYFSVTFHDKQIRHKHYVDFLVGNDIFIECKAIDHIGPEQRQQLWNYMRLSGICIGLLYNFAPVHDQCERYYLDRKTGNMYAF